MIYFVALVAGLAGILFGFDEGVIWGAVWCAAGRVAGRAFWPPTNLAVCVGFVRYRCFLCRSGARGVGSNRLSPDIGAGGRRRGDGGTFIYF